LRNIPGDKEILSAVNAEAVLLVNASIDNTNEPRLPPGFRCDMSRVGSIRRCWECAVKQYKEIHGLDPIESLRRIEADLRSPEKAAVLYK
jgi:hypothetical protein